MPKNGPATKISFRRQHRPPQHRRLRPPHGAGAPEPLVAAIALCLQSRNQLAAAGFVVMLLNVTFVRQSGYLGADLSWHIYHLFVATWLLCVARGFLKAPRTA